MVNRAISLYEFFESSMRAGHGPTRRTCRRGKRQIAAVADVHHVVAQDLEQLAARSGRGT
jgi:hypothetical protein